MKSFKQATNIKIPDLIPNKESIENGNSVDSLQWTDILNIDSEETAKYFVERFYKSGIIKLTGKVNT
jgi:hypothetical protein